MMTDDPPKMAPAQTAFGRGYRGGNALLANAVTP